MFICSKCGVVSANQRQFKIPVAIREVSYLEQMQIVKPDGEEKLKTIKKTTGTEIVKEEVYCKEHLPDIKPKVVESITRTILIGTKRLRKRAERLKIKKG